MNFSKLSTHEARHAAMTLRRVVQPSGSTTEYLEMDSDSQEVLDHFGPGALGALNRYACALEDELIRSMAINKVLKEELTVGRKKVANTLPQKKKGTNKRSRRRRYKS